MNKESAEGDVEHQTTQEDRNLYGGVMTKVKLRIDEAGRQLWKSQLDERNLVYGAVQLRLAIEEIAYSSFRSQPTGPRRRSAIHAR